ncbi:MAG: Ig-like domain-containing protein [Chryseolinea sp.]
MKILKQIRWVVCMLFALSCARVTSPTGGPKDSIPPILIQSNPKHGEINFIGQQIDLTFNEALILNTPKDQIIITPAVGKDFEATLKKNKVTIRFDNPLTANTTYSVNLREAIQDITEKNPAENVHIAFSTGEYIDSLSIAGSLYELLTSAPVKDGTVALYEKDTFNIFRHKPIFFTKTDNKGYFELSNLKPGNYFIYAIVDNNKNLVADSRSENYGFIATPLTLTSNIKNTEISLVRLDARNLKLTSARPTQTFFNIKFSKNIKSYSLSTRDNQTVYASFGADQENIRVYNPGYITDSLLVHLQATDSMSHKIDTSLYVKFSSRELKPEPFQINNNGFTASAINGTLTGSFEVNKPLAALSFDSLFYQIDSTTIIPFTRENVQYDTIHNLLTITRRIDKKLLLKPKEIAARQSKPRSTETAPRAIQNTKTREYTFYAGGGTFVSIDGDSSKRIEASAKPATLESTGMIIVQIKTAEKNYIIELLAKDKVVASRYSIPTTTFEDLQPGEYKIRLAIDKNGDREWSPGNFDKKEEPEPVVYYHDENRNQIIRLKANFELGPLLITY